MALLEKLSDGLQVKAHERLNALFNDAGSKMRLLGIKHVFRKPDLSFKQRGKIAGSALLQKNVIRINEVLYRQNTEYFMTQVIAHELAHILVYQLYGLRVKPHGNEWKKVMLEVFELEPAVTHTLNVAAVARQSFVYECDCQQMMLSIVRHNKVKRGKQTYICRKCKTVLREMFEQNEACKHK